MTNFWDYNVWGFVGLMSILLIGLLAGNLLKKSVKFLKYSLIPTSVIGGILVLIVSLIYEAITGTDIFDTEFFSYNGSAVLEMITYHCLALGFIASIFKPNSEKLTKKRSIEILNTGMTTVSSYLLQGILGIVITYSLSFIIKDVFAASGALLPFGYGQGTGQAMNYGNIYETQFGFVGGKSFGLTIAALGFISAGIGGVIYLNILRKKGVVSISEEEVTEAINSEQIQNPDEVPMNASIDKLTIQIAIIAVSYVIVYILMAVLGNIVGEGLKATIYGFNFLFGVIAASLVKAVLSFLEKKNIVRKKYVNPFLMKRLSNFFFDIMIIAGVAAIRLEMIKKYWWLLLILGVVGAVSTYFYNLFVARKLFPEYSDEQFLVMYGMLTGTASTGVILLREKDVDFKTPAMDNLVYQNLPAIVFGFPMMLLATLAPKNTWMTLVILVLFFAVMNILLFRSFIFRRKNK